MKPASRLLQILFFALIVRPVVLIFLGINIHQRRNLPRHGPMVLAANHNSHLDTVVLMSLFPLRQMHKVRPVAAADYWLKNRFLVWFSHNIIHAIPITRNRESLDDDPLAPIVSALEAGDTAIFFPEGSRGEPEELSEFKSGIAHLARRCPTVPIVPIYLRGMGKALPRGDSLLLPFFCHVTVGRPLTWNGSKELFMKRVVAEIKEMAAAAG